MHDRNGTALKVGDILTIEYQIESTSAGEDYCNISARSVAGRKPDGAPEYFSGNAAVCVLQHHAPESAQRDQVADLPTAA